MNHLVALILAGMLPAVVVQAQPKPADPVQTPELETLLRESPQTDEAVQVRIDLARQRIDALTAPASTQPDQPEETAAKLRETAEATRQAWESYLEHLQHFLATKQGIAKLTSEHHIQQRSAELSQLDGETAELRGTQAALQVTEERITALQSELSAAKARIEALDESQRRRSALLAGGFQQQREQIQDEIRKLKEQREKVQQQIDVPPAAPDGPGNVGRLGFEVRRLDVPIATAAIKLLNLPLEQQEAELRVKQDQRLLDALREKATALDRRVSELTKAKSKSRLEDLEADRKAATSPATIALLDLQRFAERVLLRYFQPAAPSADAILQAVPLTPVRNRLAASAAFWARTLGTLDHRSSAEVERLHNQIKNELRELSEQLSAQRSRLNAVLDEHQRLQSTRESVRRRFAVLQEQLNTATRTLSATERTRIEAESTTAHAGLNKAMDVVIKNVDEHVEQLGELLASLEVHKSDLQTLEQRLHWRRLISRDSGLYGAEWSVAWAELKELLGRPQTAPGVVDHSDAGSKLDTELFGEHEDAGTDVRELLATARSDLAAITPADWVWCTVVLVGLATLGLVLYRIGRRKGVCLAQEIVLMQQQVPTEEHLLGLGVSARLDLMLLNMLGDLAVPLLLAGAGMLIAGRLIHQETVHAWVGIVLGASAVAVTLWRLVHHLFEADSAVHRPIPCGDTVARHYRWWLNALILFSFAALLLPLMLRSAQLAPSLRGVAVEVCKAGVLILVFLFLLRKRRVLGSGFAAVGHWWSTLAFIVYPVVVLSTTALLVLQLIGFGVLVTFVGSGLLWSAATVVLAFVIMEYLTDALERNNPQESVVAPAGGGSPTTTLPAVVGTHYLIDFTKWFVRLVCVVAAVYLMLRVWNVPLTSEKLNWRSIGLSGLVIVIALVIDRVFVTVLQTLEFRGRLPKSTANMSRRWIRGVLAGVAGLTVIAIAGFAIDSLWQFLTALLAMVAIGFVAVWSILSNILATLVILIWRPFNIGEWIEILPEGVKGQVVDINFIYTMMKTEDGAKISVPNNMFAQKFIHRQTLRAQPTRTLAEQLEADEPLSD